jgi:hypothetical protein
MRIILGFALLLSACSAEKTLTIADAELIGFQKDQQQIYQMVGAVDGWSGTIGEESVEIYQYKNSDSITTEFFQSAIAPGNNSGWMDFCQHYNIALVSKGKTACAKLKAM